MADKVKTVYDGVGIEYDESENVWRFELRGRERKMESLKAAKEAIDKPEPKSKVKFSPISAWRESDSWDKKKWIPITVTSVAESPSYRSALEVWVVDEKGNRSKRSADSVFAATEANDKIREQVTDIDVAMEKLVKRRAEVFSTLKPVDITKVGE